MRIFRKETKSTYCAVSIDLMRGDLLFNYPVEIFYTKIGIKIHKSKTSVILSVSMRKIRIKKLTYIDTMIHNIYVPFDYVLQR